MFGDDWVNCCIIRPSTRQPIYLEAVGANLAYVHCLDDSLAGVLVESGYDLSERRCLMIEGRATLRGVRVLYRSALFPLFEDGAAIDHVLGAANYRLLKDREDLITPLLRRKWL